MVAEDGRTWLDAASMAVPDVPSVSPAWLAVRRQWTDRWWLKAEMATRSKETTTTSNGSLAADHAVTFNASSADDLAVDVVKANRRKAPRER